MCIYVRTYDSYFKKKIYIYIYLFFYFQVKAQYNGLMESIKQTSFQNLQGELDSRMEALNGQVRAHQAQQALSLHKVDMEASVMEVSCRLNHKSRKYESVKR